MEMGNDNMDTMEKNRLLENRCLSMNLTYNIQMHTLRLLRKGIADMTQHFRGGYGKEKMIRYLELCVYGIQVT